MAEQKEQVKPPLYDNIHAQPAALEAVAAYQLSAGLDALTRSAELLRHSKRIVLTGMGASLFACIPLSYMLGARGWNVQTLEASELLHFVSTSLDPDTAVLLVSRSGESIEILKLLDLLDQRGCKTVGVTNVPGTTLAKRATEHILLNSPADELVAVQTYTATVMALALLGAICLGELDDARADLQLLNRRLETWIADCWAASDTWTTFFNRDAPLHILGRGAALSTVHEGVLLMHETAKTPAIPMSIAQFRHGPVEATDNRLRAIVIGTQRVSEEIDRQFADDLRRMGATIRWLGPCAKGAPVEPLCPWLEGIPERFAPIFETIPFQVLAYRAAESQGFRPGQFRWASTITSTESGFPGLDGNQP